MPLNASQIIATACRIAKVPGYTSQAGQYLNMALSTLCQTYDFDYITNTATINFVSGTSSYDLPTDHLRTREVFYNVNGAVFSLNQIDIRNFHALFNGPGVDNYPYSFATDVSRTPNQLLPYPPPSISQSVTVTYYPQMPDISNPQTSTEVPWFENQTYLINRVSAMLMMETDDVRRKQFDADSDSLLRDILTMNDDKGGYAQTIKLDRSTFRPGAVTKPNKAFPLS